MELLANDRRVRSTCLAGILAALALTGCGNLSGLDGSPKFSCKAPEGVHCASVTANYHNRAADGTRQASPAASATPESAGVAMRPGLDPVALRTPVRVLRLWIKAWEDSDHDLVDQSYVYVRINEGQWQVAHVQRAARESYAPLRPPPASPMAQPEPTTEPSSTSDGAETARGAAGSLPVVGNTR
ncbi:TraV family lipoprotein [Pseudoduganella sp. SL102]|uniref:TraV family lipoprotein n=1 Tax=Pseudoduganella sp. SL102 TaxID=2995154 RepID=UPI00248CAAC0|nr:TraV family lipoprotein [Pseudoduganella sp. SL102]WBS00160.1 TraV family lipoprotein [Pseudoduganella sp. SL102]